MNDYEKYIASRRDKIWGVEPDLGQLRHAHGLLSTNSALGLSELEKLAGSGSVMSMHYIAHAYRTGILGKPDLPRAEVWLSQAAAGGSIDAAYSLAVIRRNQGDYFGSAEACGMAAANRFPPAMYLLGLMYSRGEGVSKDVGKAREFWEDGASQGHLFSKRDLAFLLISGRFGFLQVLRGIWIFLAALIEMPFVALRYPSSDGLTGIGEPKS